MKQNKIDIVSKQLTKAIRLFFQNDDPIVIHTLIAPSHQILCGLSKHLNTAKSMIKAGGNYAEINFPYNSNTLFASLPAEVCRIIAGLHRDPLIHSQNQAEKIASRCFN